MPSVLFICSFFDVHWEIVVDVLHLIFLLRVCYLPINIPNPFRLVSANLLHCCLQAGPWKLFRGCDCSCNRSLACVSAGKLQLLIQKSTRNAFQQVWLEIRNAQFERGTPSACPRKAVTCTGNTSHTAFPKKNPRKTIGAEKLSQSNLRL